MTQIQRFLIGSAIVATLAVSSSAVFAQGTNQTPSQGSTSTGKSQLSSRDTHYLRSAAEANLMGAKIAQLASEKGTTSEIKNLGQKLAQQHNSAYQELTRIAQSKNVTIPTELDARHSRAVEHLSTRTGTDFDKTVLRHIVREQESEVRATESEATKGEDAQLKQFASSRLPTLQSDLKQARTLYAGERHSTTEPAGAQPTPQPQQTPQSEQVPPQSKPSQPSQQQQ